LDPEVWNIVGETAFHYGSHPVTDLDSALAALDRAIALDSAFTPAYVHAIAFATRLGDVPRGRSYATRLARARPSLTTSAATAYLSATEARPNYAALEEFVARADPGTLFESWAALQELGDSAEVALTLARRFAATPWPERPHADTAFRRSFLVKILLLRGHVREAARLAAGDAEAIAELAMVGAVPPRVADSTFAAWLGRGNPVARFALPWWSSRRDTLRINQFIAKAAGSRSTALPNDLAIGRAYLSLARADTLAARRAIEAIPDSACVACPFLRLTKAQLLLAARADEDASRLLAAQLLWIPDEPALGSILWDLYRGLAAERVGDTGFAARAYGRVVRMWQRADPELEHYVRQAREGLLRVRPG
jgi:hypothetical protein